MLEYTMVYRSLYNVHGFGKECPGAVKDFGEYSVGIIWGNHCGIFYETRKHKTPEKARKDLSKWVKKVNKQAYS